MNEPGSFGQVWRREKQRFSSFVIPFFTDTAMGIVVIIVAFGVGMFLQFLQAYGLAESEAEQFGRAHAWLDYAVYVTLGIDFLVRLIRNIWRDFRNDRY